MNKVLMITKTLDNKGGLGRYSLSIFEELKRQGYFVLAIVEGARSAKDAYVILRPLSGIAKFFVFIKNLISVRRKAKKFNIIHALDGWPYGVYGYFAVLGTNKKLFISGIGTYSVAPLRDLVRGLLLKRAYKRANKIFCISDYTKKQISKLAPLKNITTVLMGTTQLVELSYEEISRYKTIYEIKNNFPIVVTVGDIKERKGQLDTLKSLNLLKEKYPDFKYFIVGSDGDIYYVAKIKDFIKENSLDDNVKIVSGMYDDKELSFFYQACDVFALNSNNDGDHFEGFGLVLLEVAQFGKPVIGSKNCGIESAMKDGFNGYLTEQKDIDDISNKLVKVLDNREMLGKNSKKFYKDFSWEKTVAEYMKYYKL